MKRTTIASLLIALLTLAGCAHVAPYSVSESTLEQHLARAVANYDRQLLRDGVPLSIGLQEVKVRLGPEGRDVAVLDVAGEAALEGGVARLPVALRLQVEGAPVYDSRDKAVYLRRLRLLDSRIDSPWFTGDLAPAAQGMMGVLAQFLDNVPVYRLDESDWRQRALGMVPLDLRVEAGRLVFVPAP
jgi:hypothetical protein